MPHPCLREATRHVYIFIKVFHKFFFLDQRGAFVTAHGRVMTVLLATLTVPTWTVVTANVWALDSAAVTVGGVNSAVRLHASVKDAAQSLVTTEALVWTDSVSA